jgi:RHS repeat-associated protein
VTRTDSLGSSLSWYGSSLGGDLGVVVTDGVVTIQIADLHGDVATSLTLDGSGSVTSVGAFADFDEYGRVLTVQPDTGAVTYGWLGAKERATDEATGLLLMGVRLYNPVTGLFTSVDPVADGNTTAYAYPQDPVNKYDLDGKAWGWLKKVANVAKVVAKVAEVASFIPGPIGMVAAGVATAGYVVAGDYKAAASAAIGLVPGGKLLATVGKAAVAGAAAYGAYKAGKAAVNAVRTFKAMSAGTKIVNRGPALRVTDRVFSRLTSSRFVGVNSKLFGHGGKFNKGNVRIGWSNVGKRANLGYVGKSFRVAVGPARTSHIHLLWGGR